MYKLLYTKNEGSNKFSKTLKFETFKNFQIITHKRLKTFK